MRSRNPKKKAKENPESLVPVVHRIDGKERAFDTDYFGSDERSDAQFIYEGRRILFFETPNHAFNVAITLGYRPQGRGALKDQLAISLVKSDTDVDVLFEELYPADGSDDKRIRKYLKISNSWLGEHGPQVLRGRMHVVNPKKKTSRKATPEWQRLIKRCQKLWEHYCERPGKKRLKDVLAHLEKMKSSTSSKVKAERSRCLRAAKAEARKLKVKV